MTLLKLTKYSNTPGTFEAVWLDADDKGVHVVAYSADQLDLFRADVAQYGGEVDEVLLAEVQAEWVPPGASAPVPPQERIAQIERETLMNRATREFMIALAEKEAAVQGLTQEQLYALNAGYRAVKDVDSLIVALRAQLGAA